MISRIASRLILRRHFSGLARYRRRPHLKDNKLSTRKAGKAIIQVSTIQALVPLADFES